MKKTIALIMLLAVACACKKTDDINNTAPATNTPASLTLNDYVQLKVGNYWIYELEDVDSMGRSKGNTIYKDTLRIVDTFRQRGRLYYVTKSRYHLLNLPGSGRQGIGDSAGYLVRNSGIRIFSAFDFRNMLGEGPDTLYGHYRTSIWRMTDSAKKETVKSVTYTVSRATCYFHIPSYSNPKRTLFRDFAMGYGLVRFNFYFEDPNTYTEGRLIICHLNK